MRTLKESFNAGEFTERLHSRYELAKFKNGCKALTNFVPLPQGPVTRRPGTEYIAPVKTASKYTRLIPFEFSEDDAYIVEAGDLYDRFYRNGGQVQTVDSDTKLLLHFDGANNSTTITDDGNTVHVVTPTGNAKLKTEQKKFGSASCYFGGTGDYLSIPDSADWNFGAGAFTVDFWVRFDDVAATQGLWQQYLNTTNYQSFYFYNNSLFYEFRSTGAVTDVVIGGSWEPAADTWYHIALIRGWGGIANDYAITVNGQVVATGTDVDAHIDLAAALEIGQAYRSGNNSTRGYIDEVRATKGVARWTLPFAPPTTQYPFGDDSGTTYEIVTTYTEESLADLQYVQSADTMYNVHRDFPVRSLVRSGHTNWAIADVSFTNPPSVWAASNYPRTVEFYEDRLCFGGTPDQPDTVWTSDSSDYTNFHSTSTITATTLAFTASTITDSANGFVTAGFVADMPITVENSQSNDGTYTLASVVAGTLTVIAQDTLTVETAGEKITITGGALAADDAITFTLLARRVNAIQWMSGGRRLLIGTRGEEWWAAGPSDTEPITPADHIARRDSAWGSERVLPVDIGDVVFYVQQNGKILRELIYDFSEDKYISSNVSVLAEHLTRHYSITAMAYQQHPHQVLWCVRSDGNVIALTYLKEHEVFGWSKHTFAGGVVESVAVIPGDPEDEVWFVIKRTVNGAVVRYVERLKTFNYGTELEDAFFMDCGLTYEGAAATTISGLDHLEGEAVTILADGVVVTGKTVSSGSITLDTAASKVHIGLANTAELETLDVVASDDEGPLQGVLKRITNITLRVINSQGGLYGPDSSTTDEIIYDDTTVAYTGWTRDMSFDEQDDATSTVYIMCDEPLPMEIAAITIDLEDV